MALSRKSATQPAAAPPPTQNTLENELVRLKSRPAPLPPRVVLMALVDDGSKSMAA